MEWSSRVWCLLALTLCISQKLSAFNLEPKLAVTKKGPTGSYFGYSTAAHLIKNPGSTENVMLVGAPRANASSRADLNSPGALYKCPLTATDASGCQNVAPRVYDKGTINDEDMTNQWLGVALSTSGNLVLVCAHRNKMSSSSYRYGPGKCALLDNRLTFIEPKFYCQKSVGTGHEALGYCALGSSGVIDKDDNILIGSPGAYDWHGMAQKIFYSDLPFGSDTSWYLSAQGPKDLTNPSAVKINSHLGASTGIGNILGEKTYVSGAPRADGSGKVILFRAEKNLGGDTQLRFEPQHVLSIDNFGASFGHALVVMDLNNDGKDDLVVSAPFFSETNIGGAVYVYINDGTDITSDTEPIVLKSRTLTNAECKKINCEMVRFGFAIANIGDINRDGFQDLAIGAPYEGNGVVYIYHGSSEGIETTYTQRIESSDVPTNPKAFGASIAGGQDLDENGYSDLIVGAFESDAVVFIPTRPVMNIMAKIVDADKLTVDPKSKVCHETDQPGQCFAIRVCFKFTAEPKDRFSSTFNVKYHVTEVKETLLARLKFQDARIPSDVSSNYAFDSDVEMKAQSKNEYSCQSHVVHISKNNKDILHPVSMKLTYQLESPEPDQLANAVNEPFPDANQYPIVNQAENMIDFEVSFKKDCGPDKVCTADIGLEASWEGSSMEGDVAVLSVGSVKELNLNVKYSNYREKAYNAMLYIKLPAELSFRKRTHLDNGILCESTNLNNTMLACEFGNPFENNTDTTIRIPFPIPQSSKNTLDIEMFAHTSSEEIKLDNNNITLKLKLIVDADMLISGSSEPDQVIYSGEVTGESAIEYEEDIGDSVVHTYVVTNGGPGTVSRSEVEILWPYETENKREQGKHLLYLTQAPILEGRGRCEIDEKWINRLDVKARPSNNTDETVTYTPTRRKREVVVQAEEVKDKEGNVQKVVKMSCLTKTAKCFKFRCILNALGDKQYVVIRIRSRIWRSTFVEDYKHVDKVEVQSHASIILDPSMNIVQKSVSNDDASATTSAVPDISLRPPPEGVAIWIIIVAVCAGVLLLVILILVLWKLGFFRRHRPEDEMQKHEVKVVKDKYKYEEVNASEC